MMDGIRFRYILWNMSMLSLWICRTLITFCLPCASLVRFDEYLYHVLGSPPRHPIGIFQAICSDAISHPDSTTRSEYVLAL